MEQNKHSKEKKSWNKEIRKKILILYLFIGAILVLVAFLRKALSNKEYGTANYEMDKMTVKDTTLYNDVNDEFINYTAADMFRDNVILDFSEKDINKNSDILDIALEIIDLYERRDYRSLYEYIDVTYLNDKGYYLYLETFKQYQEGVVNDMKHYSLELRDCTAESNNTYIISGSYLELLILANGERGYRETDQEFNFTIMLKEDGTYRYLPFKESDLFVVSDFGVTLVNFN